MLESPRGALGQLCLSPTLILILVAGCGLVALIDHRGNQGITHLISDITLIGLAIPALILLVMPLQKAHTQVLDQHQELTAHVLPLVQAQTNEMRHEIIHLSRLPNAGEVESIASATALIASPGYPINFGMIVQMLSTFLLPVLVTAKAIFGDQLGFNEKENGDEQEAVGVV